MSREELLVMLHNATPIEKINKNPTAEDWEIIAKELFKIIDDIDTYSDMYKPEHTNYYKAVMRKVKDKRKFIGSDGYDIFPIIQD